jgi:CubicO group peptidase (beta-lactamase class C family)
MKALVTLSISLTLLLGSLATRVAVAEPPMSITPDRCESARKYSEANGGQSMLVMCDGKIIFERYGNGGGAERRQTLASGTKSFVGVAAVAAVEDGLIRLDDPACESLTEWKSDPLKSQITYRQLLTLTSGLTPGERGEGGRNPAWKEVFTKPMSGKPGRQFEYGAYHLNAFGEALQRRLGKETFEQYLVRRVLKPLGITLEWRIRCPDGNPQLGGGGAMTARDWAWFGEFMRLEGQWGGKQLIRKELLADCLKGTPQNPAYGLTWWLREPVPDAIIRQVPILQRDMGDIVKSIWLPEDLFMAAGAGKQRLYVIPSMKVVIVRQGDLRASRGFSDAEFLSRLLRGEAGKGTDSTQSPPNRAGAGQDSTPRGAMQGGMLDERFRQLDRNHDGKLTRDEVPRAELFDRMDANKDGIVNLDEAKRAFSRWK